MKNFKTIAAIQKAILAGEISCVDLVEFHLKKIQEQQDLNAFLEVFDHKNLIERANLIDEKIRTGKAGKLAGLVLGIKDVIAYANHKFSASSRILEGFESQFTATALQRVIDEDAIIIGRQNCDEFAMGSSNENSAFGIVKNPLNKEYVPGGSSGGSSAAIAANLCQISLGSDTGGSVRQPASYCGVYGLKPTYGRVSRYGLIAYASSFDQICPITKSLDDAFLIFSVMNGKDERDVTSSTKPGFEFKKTQNPDKKYRIAVFREMLEHPGLDSEVREKTTELIETFQKNGHLVNFLEFPYLEHLVPTYYVLTTAEASSNLSRYDGIRYGFRSDNSESLDSLYQETRATAFGPEVKRRIMLGTFVLSTGFFDAYYQKAMKVRRVLSEFMNNIFEEHDVVISPTAPTTAFKIGEKSEDPIAMYLADIYTVLANLTGIPALSMPFGKHTENEMPYGIQLMTNMFEEQKLYEVANSIEKMIEVS